MACDERIVNGYRERRRADRAIDSGQFIRKGAAKDEARPVLAAPWDRWATPSARKMPRRTPCSNGDVWRRSTIPAWNKFFGSPADPSTALVFGEKGSGKTALRLQADCGDGKVQSGEPGRASLRHLLRRFQPVSRQLPDGLRATDMAQVLEKWRLQDHMDAILSLGRDQLVDLLTAEKVDLTVLSLDQRRDLLLLAALYDASTGEPIRADGAGCAAVRASGRSGPAATCRSASARPGRHRA